MTELLANPTHYTSLDELKVLMGLDPDESAEDLLLNARLMGLIEVISRSIDSYCRRHFYPREETRTYQFPKVVRGKPRTLWLGYDLLAVAEMHSDERVFTEEEYVLYPRNQWVKGWIEFPDQRLYRVPWTFGRDAEPPLEITGTWGFVTPESEAIIKQACQLWIMELNQRSLYPGAQSVSIGDYSYSFRGDSEQRLNTPNGQTILTPPGQVALLLNGYRRIEIFGSWS